MRHTHEALREYYRGGEHSWLDAEGENRWPNGARPRPLRTRKGTPRSLRLVAPSACERMHCALKRMHCVSQLATLVLWWCSAPPPSIVRDAMVAGADLMVDLAPPP